VTSCPGAGFLLALLAGGCAFLPAEDRPPSSDSTTVRGLLLAPDAPAHLVCGHRGAFFRSFLGAGPNTIEAYEMALLEGADILEVDIRTTLDRVPVIAHDWGPESRTMAAWRARGRDWLTLRTLLAWARGRTVLLLDVKTRDAPAVTRELRRSRATERALLLAGGPGEYTRFRRAGHDTWVVAAAHRPSDVGRWLARPDARLVAIQVDAAWLSARLVRRIHDAGRRIWTDAFDAVWHRELLGGHGTAEALFARGIDVIQTNVPGDAARARDDARSRPPAAR
jgi:glycerophosphoryl diester phosphodiesterase